MASRVELHEALSKAFASINEWYWLDTQPEEWTEEDLYQEIYDNHVYFQQPPTFAMDYPCIIYKQIGGNTRHANNYPYNFKKRYSVIVVDTNPDSRIPGAIGKISGCQLDRAYSVDNLYHWAFNLYY